MDGTGLSRQEQLILTAIERELCGDRRLDRRLRTMARRSMPLAAARGLLRHVPLGGTVAVLALLSVTLFQSAAASSSPALIWAFAAVWACTLVAMLLLVRRWCRGYRRRGREGRRS
ncbi:hypothetical protein [Streptomyces sp. NPDC088762]|uniref:hypothetical protein n=1 Tax=Streptomyces sp. NPDC088762 TaxID=3365891 RepID=UPI00382A6562